MHDFLRKCRNNLKDIWFETEHKKLKIFTPEKGTDCAGNIASATYKYIFYTYFQHKVGKVCIRANVAHQAGAYPGLCSMKRLGVFLLPPGWDASPSQGYPQH